MIPMSLLYWTVLLTLARHQVDGGDSHVELRELLDWWSIAQTLLLDHFMLEHLILLPLQMMVNEFDIQIAVVTMGHFRVASHQGHLECVKKIFGFIKKYPEVAINFRTFKLFTIQKCEKPDWTYSYGNIKGEIPEDMPELKRIPVIMLYQVLLMHHIALLLH